MAKIQSNDRFGIIINLRDMKLIITIPRHYYTERKQSDWLLKQMIYAFSLKLQSRWDILTE